MDSAIGRYIPQLTNTTLDNKATSAKAIDGKAEIDQLGRVLQQFNSKRAGVSFNLRVENFANAAIPAEEYDQFLQWLAKEERNPDAAFVRNTILAANNITDTNYAQGLQKLQNVVFVAAILEKIQNKQEPSEAQWNRMDSIAQSVGFSFSAYSESEILALQTKVALPVVIASVSPDIKLVQDAIAKLNAGKDIADWSGIEALATRFKVDCSAGSSAQLEVLLKVMLAAEVQRAAPAKVDPIPEPHFLSEPKQAAYRELSATETYTLFKTGAYEIKDGKFIAKVGTKPASDEVQANAQLQYLLILEPTESERTETLRLTPGEPLPWIVGGELISVINTVTFSPVLFDKYPLVYAKAMAYQEELLALMNDPKKEGELVALKSLYMADAQKNTLSVEYLSLLIDSPRYAQTFTASERGALSQARDYLKAHPDYVSDGVAYAFLGADGYVPADIDGAMKVLNQYIAGVSQGVTVRSLNMQGAYGPVKFLGFKYAVLRNAPAGSVVPGLNAPATNVENGSKEMLSVYEPQIDGYFLKSLLADTATMRTFTAPWAKPLFNYDAIRKSFSVEDAALLETYEKKYSNKVQALTTLILDKYFIGNQTSGYRISDTDAMPVVLFKAYLGQYLTEAFNVSEASQLDVISVYAGKSTISPDAWGSTVVTATQKTALAKLALSELAYPGSDMVAVREGIVYLDTTKFPPEQKQLLEISPDKVEALMLAKGVKDFDLGFYKELYAKLLAKDPTELSTFIKGKQGSYDKCILGLLTAWGFTPASGVVSLEKPNPPTSPVAPEFGDYGIAQSEYTKLIAILKTVFATPDKILEALFGYDEGTSRYFLREGAWGSDLLEQLRPAVPSLYALAGAQEKARVQFTTAVGVYEKSFQAYKLEYTKYESAVAAYNTKLSERSAQNNQDALQYENTKRELENIFSKPSMDLSLASFLDLIEGTAPDKEYFSLADRLAAGTLGSAPFGTQRLVNTQPAPINANTFLGLFDGGNIPITSYASIKPAPPKASFDSYAEFCAAFPAAAKSIKYTTPGADLGVWDFGADALNQYATLPKALGDLGQGVVNGLSSLMTAAEDGSLSKIKSDEEKKQLLDTAILLASFLLPTRAVGFFYTMMQEAIRELSEGEILAGLGQLLPTLMMISLYTSAMFKLGVHVVRPPIRSIYEMATGKTKSFDFDTPLGRITIDARSDQFIKARKTVENYLKGVYGGAVDLESLVFSERVRFGVGADKQLRADYKTNPELLADKVKLLSDDMASNAKDVFVDGDRIKVKPQHKIRMAIPLINRVSSAFIVGTDKKAATPPERYNPDGTRKADATYNAEMAWYGTKTAVKLLAPFFVPMARLQYTQRMGAIIHITSTYEGIPGLISPVRISFAQGDDGHYYPSVAFDVKTFLKKLSLDNPQAYKKEKAALEKISSLVDLHKYVMDHPDSPLVETIQRTDEYRVATQDSALELFGNKITAYFASNPDLFEKVSDQWYLKSPDGTKILLSSINLTPELSQTKFAFDKPAGFSGAESTRGSLLIGSDLLQMLKRAGEAGEDPEVLKVIDTEMLTLIENAFPKTFPTATPNPQTATQDWDAKAKLVVDMFDKYYAGGFDKAYTQLFGGKAEEAQKFCTQLAVQLADKINPTELEFNNAMTAAYSSSLVESAPSSDMRFALELAKQKVVGLKLTDKGLCFAWAGKTYTVTLDALGKFVGVPDQLQETFKLLDGTAIKTYLSSDNLAFQAKAGIPSIDLSQDLFGGLKTLQKNINNYWIQASPYATTNKSVEAFELKYTELTHEALLKEIADVKAKFAADPTNPKLQAQAIALEREAYWRTSLDAQWAEKPTGILSLSTRFKAGLAPDLNDIGEGKKYTSLDDYITKTAGDGTPRDVVNGFRINHMQTLGILVQNAGQILDAPCGEGKTVIIQMASVLKLWQGQQAIIATSHDGLAKDGVTEVEKGAAFFKAMCGPDFKVDYFDFSDKGTASVLSGKGKAGMVYMSFRSYGFQKLSDRLSQKSGGKTVFDNPDKMFMFFDEIDTFTVKQAMTPYLISGDGGKYTSSQDVFCRAIDAKAEAFMKDPANLVRYGLAINEVTKKLYVVDAVKWNAFVNIELPKFIEETQLDKKVLDPYNAEQAKKGGVILDPAQFRATVESQLEYSLIARSKAYEYERDYKVGYNPQSPSAHKGIVLLSTYTDEANFGSSFTRDLPFDFFGGLQGALEAKELHTPSSKVDRLTERQGVFEMSQSEAESMLVRTMLLETRNWAGTSGTALIAADSFVVFGKQVVAVDKIAGRKMNLYESAFADAAMRDAEFTRIVETLSTKGPAGVFCPDPTKVSALKKLIIDKLIAQGLSPAAAEEKVKVFDHNTPDDQMATVARAASKDGSIVIFTNLGGRGKDWMSAYNDILDKLNENMSKALSDGKTPTVKVLVDSIRKELETKLTKYAAEKKGAARPLAEIEADITKANAMMEGLKLFEESAGKTVLAATITQDTVKDILKAPAFVNRSFNLVIYEKPAGGLPDFVQALNRADRGSKGAEVYVLSCIKDDLFSKVGIDPTTLIKPSADGRYHATISAAEIIKLIPDIKANWQQYKGLFDKTYEGWDGKTSLEFVSDFSTKLERSGLTMTTISDLEKAWKSTDLGRIATLSDIALAYINQQEIDRTNPDPYQQKTIEDQERLQRTVTELNHPVQIEYALQQMRGTIASEILQTVRGLSEADFVKAVKAQCAEKLFLGTVTKSAIPEKELVKVKDLFVDIALNQPNANLEFKPGVTLDAINKLSVSDAVKAVLQKALVALDEGAIKALYADYQSGRDVLPKVINMIDTAYNTQHGTMIPLDTLDSSWLSKTGVNLGEYMQELSKAQKAYLDEVKGLQGKTGLDIMSRYELLNGAETRYKQTMSRITTALYSRMADPSQPSSILSIYRGAGFRSEHDFKGALTATMTLPVGSKTPVLEYKLTGFAESFKTIDAAWVAYSKDISTIPLSVGVTELLTQHPGYEIPFAVKGKVICMPSAARLLDGGSLDKTQFSAVYVALRNYQNGATSFDAFMEQVKYDIRTAPALGKDIALQLETLGAEGVKSLQALIAPDRCAWTPVFEEYANDRLGSGYEIAHLHPDGDLTPSEVDKYFKHTVGTVRDGNLILQRSDIAGDTDALRIASRQENLFEIDSTYISAKLITKTLPSVGVDRAASLIDGKPLAADAEGRLSELARLPQDLQVQYKQYYIDGVETIDLSVWQKAKVCLDAQVALEKALNDGSVKNAELAPFYAEVQRVLVGTALTDFEKKTAISAALDSVPLAVRDQVRDIIFNRDAVATTIEKIAQANPEILKLGAQTYTSLIMGYMERVSLPSAGYLVDTVLPVKEVYQQALQQTPKTVVVTPGLDLRTALGGVPEGRPVVLSAIPATIRAIDSANAAKYLYGVTQVNTVVASYIDQLQKAGVTMNPDRMAELQGAVDNVLQGKASTIKFSVTGYSAPLVFDIGSDPLLRNWTTLVGEVSRGFTFSIEKPGLGPALSAAEKQKFIIDYCVNTPEIRACFNAAGVLDITKATALTGSIAAPTEARFVRESVFTTAREAYAAQGYVVIDLYDAAGKTLFDAEGVPRYVVATEAEVSAAGQRDLSARIAAQSGVDATRTKTELTALRDFTQSMRTIQDATVQKVYDAVGSQYFSSLLQLSPPLTGAQIETRLADFKQKFISSYLPAFLEEVEAKVADGYFKPGVGYSCSSADLQRAYDSAYKDIQIRIAKMPMDEAFRFADRIATVDTTDVAGGKQFTDLGERLSFAQTILHLSPQEWGEQIRKMPGGAPDSGVGTDARFKLFFEQSRLAERAYVGNIENYKFVSMGSWIKETTKTLLFGSEVTPVKGQRLSVAASSQGGALAMMMMMTTINTVAQGLLLNQWPKDASDWASRYTNSIGQLAMLKVGSSAVQTFTGVSASMASAMFLYATMITGEGNKYRSGESWAIASGRAAIGAMAMNVLEDVVIAKIRQIPSVANSMRLASQKGLLFKTLHGGPLQQIVVLGASTLLQTALEATLVNTGLIKQEWVQKSLGVSRLAVDTWQLVKLGQGAARLASGTAKVALSGGATAASAALTGVGIALLAMDLVNVTGTLLRNEYENLAFEMELQDRFDEKVSQQFQQVLTGGYNITSDAQLNSFLGSTAIVGAGFYALGDFLGVNAFSHNIETLFNPSLALADQVQYYDRVYARTVDDTAQYMLSRYERGLTGSRSSPDSRLLVAPYLADAYIAAPFAGADMGRMLPELGLVAHSEDELKRQIHQTQLLFLEVMKMPAFYAYAGVPATLFTSGSSPKDSFLTWVRCLNLNLSEKSLLSIGLLGVPYRGVDSDFYSLLSSFADKLGAIPADSTVACNQELIDAMTLIYNLIKQRKGVGYSFDQVRPAISADARMQQMQTVSAALYLKQVQQQASTFTSQDDTESRVMSALGIQKQTIQSTGSRIQSDYPLDIMEKFISTTEISSLEMFAQGAVAPKLSADVILERRFTRMIEIMNMQLLGKYIPTDADRAAGLFNNTAGVVTYPSAWRDFYQAQRERILTSIDLVNRGIPQQKTLSEYQYEMRVIDAIIIKLDDRSSITQKLQSLGLNFKSFWTSAYHLTKKEEALSVLANMYLNNNTPEYMLKTYIAILQDHGVVISSAQQALFARAAQAYASLPGNTEQRMKTDTYRNIINGFNTFLDTSAFQPYVRPVVLSIPESAFLGAQRMDYEGDPLRVRKEGSRYVVYYWSAEMQGYAPSSSYTYEASTNKIVLSAAGKLSPRSTLLLASAIDLTGPRWGISMAARDYLEDAWPAIQSDLASTQVGMAYYQVFQQGSEYSLRVYYYKDRTEQTPSQYKDYVIPKKTIADVLIAGVRSGELKAIPPTTGRYQFTELSGSLDRSPYAIFSQAGKDVVYREPVLSRGEYKYQESAIYDYDKTKRRLVIKPGFRLNAVTAIPLGGQEYSIAVNQASLSKGTMGIVKDYLADSGIIDQSKDTINNLVLTKLKDGTFFISVEYSFTPYIGGPVMTGRRICKLPAQLEIDTGVKNAFAAVGALFYPESSKAIDTGWTQKGVYVQGRSSGQVISNVLSAKIRWMQNTTTQNSRMDIEIGGVWYQGDYVAANCWRVVVGGKTYYTGNFAAAEAADQAAILKAKWYTDSGLRFVMPTTGQAGTGWYMVQAGA